tara:strand:- start:388 stop:1014 length:627 start_codon:yes stop_codon:yes gene_type:complete
MIIDYKKIIHKDCGKKIDIIKDIIITPFYTEDFCDELVNISKFYSEKFTPYITYYDHVKNKDTQEHPWDTLFFSKINYFLFEDFCKQYETFITPIIEKHFKPENVKGWFSPMIIRYSRPGQFVKLHNDTSEFTLNVKLNDNYKGSLLKFPRQNFDNKDIPKGWSMVWPSTVTHPHETTPLKKGTKYTLSSWSHPPSWSHEEMGGSIKR